ncbi:MAG: HAD hydrolase-like protein [Acidimicrobiia bacterium]|jgi:phosphoglycolate phosphatase
MTGVLFDLDWTLIDVQTHTDYDAAFHDVSRALERWPEVSTPATSWDGPTRACMGILVALAGRPGWAEASALIESHEMRAVEASRAMPGLAEVLAVTAHRPRGVVTLLPDRAARAALDRHGVDIDVIVPRRPDLRPKPAPDQVLEAARLLSLDVTELVMVGDSTWDLEAALAAGATFIGITNGRPAEFPSGTEMVDDLFELAARLGTG